MTKGRRARFAVMLALLGAGITVWLLWRRATPAATALPPVDESQVTSGAHPSVLVTEPLTLIALERRGFTLNKMLGAGGATNAELVDSRAYADLVRTLEADLKELSARPTIGDERAPNHPFKVSWLSDKDARFELTGVVPRIDRAFVEPGICGEIRLIYRLALTRENRPTTRLPMTLNVLMVPHGDAGACQKLAAEIASVPPEGVARVTALAELLKRRVASPRRIEVNVQNLHGPSLRKDEDDHAEYLLRSFDVTESGLRPRKLLNTPREDLTAAEKATLATWIAQNFDAIDRGTSVIPDAFLATRAISVTPRGLARKRNRVFDSLLGADAEKLFASISYDKAKLVRSPRALLRRLDEGTCQGCHESRAVAGFHLLGEERDDARTFNALAVGRSNHLIAELPWRERFLDAAAKGVDYTEPRPFAERGGGGVHGARCGLGDPGFSAFSCAPGLVCRNDVIDELGACTHADANHEGDACERARVTPEGDRPDGDSVRPEPKQACTVGGKVVPSDACSPNAYGFPGGLCSDACDAVGRVEGETICADIPAAGYESDCFPTDVSIETCIKTHLARRRVRSCDDAHPCRDDFGCARVENAPKGTGACVPPYFVFQARVDGPRTDR